MASKSAPFTLRLSATTDQLVTEEARRTKRSKGAVVEALADEALRTRLFPGIAFRGVDWERRPWVLGTGLDVWQIVEAFRDFGSVERMAAGSEVTEREARLALAYYERFPNEIDAAIQVNQSPLETLRERFPVIEASQLAQ